MNTQIYQSKQINKIPATENLKKKNFKMASYSSLLENLKDCFCNE